jgi:selenocysteine lyase/cysteine desulfurase
MDANWSARNTRRMPEQNDSRSTPLAEAGRPFLLRPDITFLNHGSFGASPAPVFETYQRWQRELEAEPVEFLGRRIRSLLEEARAPLAAYLGIERDDIVFVPNATHGVNIVARSLQKLLRPGDEVLGTDHEYGAVERTWRFLTEQVGAVCRSQPVQDADDLLFAEAALPHVLPSCSSRQSPLYHPETILGAGHTLSILLHYVATYAEYLICQ